MKKNHYIQYTFEMVGDVSDEELERARCVLDEGASILEKEWNLTSEIAIKVNIYSNKAFREEPDGGPFVWNYCFILRDQPANNLYINVGIFETLPNDADAMIKHEIAHIVIAERVNNMDAYRNCFLLEEGSAGLDNATDRLIQYLKKNNIPIPNPLTFDSMNAVKEMGGDTNVDPFTLQLGYLILFSFVEYLREKYGEEKIVEIYTLCAEKNFEEAFTDIIGVSLKSDIEKWRQKVTKI